MVKARRHQRILDIVRSKPIQTQEDLSAELAREGMWLPRPPYPGISRNFG